MTSPNLNSSRQFKSPVAQPPGQSPQQTHAIPQYVQPYYISEEPAVPVIAELPAPPPPAPPTTTSQHQLNQDELLARKLHQLEVEEARRRTFSLSNHPSLQQSLNAPSQPNLRHSYQGHAHQHRLQSRSVSSLTPLGLASAARSRSLSQEASAQPAPYGPDSFDQPIGLDTTDLPEVAAGPTEWDPEWNQFLEVTAVPRIVESSGELRDVPSLTSHPTTHLPAAPEDVTSISKYLEQHRQVPYPRQWSLLPAVATLYATSTHSPKSESWLDTPLSQQWHVNRITSKARKSAPPAFEFSFKSKGGGSFRDPQFAWTMAQNTRPGKLRKESPQEWRYLLKMDSSNKIRKSENLQPPRPAAGILTTYVHAANYDTLRFLGPGGRSYKWVSHAPVTTMHGARFDALRHALFMSTDGTSDPLYGHIVADHTYWDGYLDTTTLHAHTTCSVCNKRPVKGVRWKCRVCINDHTICDACHTSRASVKNTCVFTLINLPDETLHIRSASVDPALVVATLQILKDWELYTLRMEKAKDPLGFEYSEKLARKGDLGRIRYWLRQDFDRKGRWRLEGEVFGTVARAREIEEGGAGAEEGEGGDAVMKQDVARKSVGDGDGDRGAAASSSSLQN